MIHSRWLALHADDAGVFLRKDEPAAFVVDLHHESPLLLYVNADLVGGGVGVKRQRKGVLLRCLVKVWRQCYVVDPRSVVAA